MLCQSEFPLAYQQCIELRVSIYEPYTVSDSSSIPVKGTRRETRRTETGHPLGDAISSLAPERGRNRGFRRTGGAGYPWGITISSLGRHTGGVRNTILRTRGEEYKTTHPRGV